MQIKVNGKKEDISAMLVGAERYALGRRTYMVQWTCEFIENNLHLLTEKDKNVIIRDIEQQIDYQELEPGMRWLGDKCDEEEWLKLLKILKELVEDK